MKADNIKNIISDIDHLPYRAILFDGTWGIGKSYAVNEALEANPNVCKISMFGLKDPKQIYHEALFQLALKNNIGGKIGEITNNVLDGLSKIWDKVGQAKEVVQSIANERELFLLLSKEFTSVHIIVIDDLERMSDDINLEDIFGIIEELKQCNYVKVIVIANTDEIQSDKKVVFENYANFNGRARRAEYWWFFLFNLIITYGLIILGSVLEISALVVLSQIYSLAVLIPSLAVAVRRVHDVGKSGWFILIPIYSLILVLTEGNRGTNEYGSDPKNSSLDEINEIGKE
mgnify:CR=1 FL=1